MKMATNKIIEIWFSTEQQPQKQKQHRAMAKKWEKLAK